MIPCKNCGTAIPYADPTHCPNCGEIVTPEPAGERSANGFRGAGIGCVTYIAFLLGSWFLEIMPWPDLGRLFLNAGIIAGFLFTVVYVAIRNYRKPGWLTGYLIVMLVPLGALAACFGIITYNFSTSHH